MSRLLSRVAATRFGVAPPAPDLGNEAATFTLRVFNDGIGEPGKLIEARVSNDGMSSLADSGPPPPLWRAPSVQPLCPFT